MQARGRIPPTLPRENPTISYWHDPLASIANLRSTEELPESVDYVIVGSGVSGACIAWTLLQREKDAEIVMLEARTAVGGATGRNGESEFDKMILASSFLHEQSIADFLISIPLSDLILSYVEFHSPFIRL